MASDEYILVFGDSKPIWCPTCNAECGQETPMYWVSTRAVNSLNPSRSCPRCRTRNIPQENHG
jgi:hypothetical protein